MIQRQSLVRPLTLILAISLGGVASFRPHRKHNVGLVILAGDARRISKSPFGEIAVMGFLSTFGKIIIGLSVLGSLYGVYDSFVLASNTIGFLAFIGLIGGVYIGYLGIKVDEVDGGAYSASQIVKLEQRLNKLEGKKQMFGDEK
jgi:hypothetical protein